MRASMRPRGIRRQWDAYRGDTRAAAAVELALTFPFFLLFISILMELTVFHFATSGVEQGVFDYSRRLIEMTDKGQRRIHRDQLNRELLKFVGGPLIAKVRFDIGSATEKTNFSKKLTGNQLQDFVADKTKPVYLRVVATRRTFVYGMFQPVWDVITNPANGGLFSDIDVLVVIPWPPEDAS